MPAKKVKSPDVSPALVFAKLADGLLAYLRIAGARDKVTEQMMVESMGLLRRFVTQQEEQELRRQAMAQEARNGVLNALHHTNDAVARANFFHSPGPAMPALTPFTDTRGDITNIAENSVGGVQVISSKAGSTRAKHIHKTDTHVCYVVSGQVDYKERSVVSDDSILPHRLIPDPDSETRSFTFLPGTRFVTGPDIAHQMDFPVDTVLVVMSEHPRDPKSYDADIVKFTESL